MDTDIIILFAVLIIIWWSLMKKDKNYAHGRAKTINWKR